MGANFAYRLFKKIHVHRLFLHGFTERSSLRLPLFHIRKFDSSPVYARTRGKNYPQGFSQRYGAHGDLVIPMGMS
jgi:hypothetical protein